MNLYSSVTGLKDAIFWQSRQNEPTGIIVKHKMFSTDPLSNWVIIICGWCELAQCILNKPAQRACPVCSMLTGYWVMRGGESDSRCTMSVTMPTIVMATRPYADLVVFTGRAGRRLYCIITTHDHINISQTIPVYIHYTASKSTNHGTVDLVLKRDAHVTHTFHKLHFCLYDPFLD